MYKKKAPKAVTESNLQTVPAAIAPHFNKLQQAATSCVQAPFLTSLTADQSSLHMKSRMNEAFFSFFACSQRPPGPIKAYMSLSRGRSGLCHLFGVHWELRRIVLRCRLNVDMMVLAISLEVAVSFTILSTQFLFEKNLRLQ